MKTTTNPIFHRVTLTAPRRKVYITEIMFIFNMDYAGNVVTLPSRHVFIGAN